MKIRAKASEILVAVARASKTVDDDRAKFQQQIDRISIAVKEQKDTPSPQQTKQLTALHDFIDKGRKVHTVLEIMSRTLGALPAADVELSDHESAMLGYGAQ